MRRVNPIAAEADDIVRVVKRLEEAIRALHQVADLLPLLIASGEAKKPPSPDASAEDERAAASSAPTPPGKEATDADPSGESDPLD